MELAFTQVLNEQLATAKWIENIVVNTDKATKKNAQTVGSLGTRLAILGGYWDTFTSTHRQLLRFSEFEDSVYSKEDVYSTTMDMYVANKTELEERISKLRAESMAATNTNSAKSGQLSPTSSAPNFAETLLHQQHLGKIALPTFDGDPLKWESFRDLFKTLVIDVPGLPDCNKFLHLQTQLTGEAAELIKNTHLTNTAFSGAWEDLEARYGNPRILSLAHMKSLFSIPSAQKSNPGEIKRLIDSFRQSVRAFQTLKKPVAHWDEFFVFLLVQKLDNTTRLVWETSLSNSKEIPSFKTLIDFLENRVHALEFAFANVTKDKTQESQKNKPILNNNTRFGKTAFTVTKSVDKPESGKTKSKIKQKTTPRKGCLLCSGEHVLNYCPEFKQLPVAIRRQKAAELGTCFNCLREGHITTACTSTSRCLICNKSHHTLLHSQPGKPSVPSLGQSNRDNGDTSTVVGCCSLNATAEKAVFIASARVRIVNESGESIEVRALLDTCAEASLITEAAARRLNLKPSPVNIPVSGVQGCSAGTANRAVNFRLESPRDDTLTLNIQALVLTRITNQIPSSPVKVKPWSHLRGLPLADPDFTKPGEIDLLLGANVTGHLLLDESRKGELDEPVGRLTPFGWVIMGPADFVHSNRASSQPLLNTIHMRTIFSETKLWEDQIVHYRPKVICHCAVQSITKNTNNCVSCDLQKFWEHEELPQDPILTEDDKRCEKFYVDNFRRNESGRYIVRLPFSDEPTGILEPNKSAAMAVLISNERRFSGDQILKSEYLKFMQEYSQLHHMAPTTSSPMGTFLPHHGIWKAGPKPKLRVVFNASHVTKSGKSLNDCLSAGQKLQTDLWTVVTRARFFKIFFTADIVKMFRQILVDPKDACWQKILWRSSESERVQEYALSTVTYGTKCAPFLALRTLIQLASDEGSRFPLGAEVVRDTSYVDDFLAGGDDISSALEVKRHLQCLLQSGGFELGKWASNSTEFGSNLVTESKTLQESETISTLGLTWSPIDDAFSLKVDLSRFKSGPVTKRSVLSDVARLFDPLGWFAPALISAKILIQNIWVAGLDWDQTLNPELLEQWTSFRSALPLLEKIKIPRWLGTLSFTRDKLELHVFCDASERAYSTTIFLRVVGEHSSQATLLMAKTKVAPVKTLSIPRLELCGALLAAKLAIQLQKSLKLVNNPIFAYCDSQVALAWIRSHASKWSVFVAHRVSKIQSLIPPESWRYIRTSDNPADLATRGITPKELKESTLWWAGPSYLLETGFTSKHCDELPQSVLERRTVLLTEVSSSELGHENDLVIRYSDLNRSIRIMAYCLRFIHNLTIHAHPERSAETSVGLLSTLETSAAFRRLIFLSQQFFFSEEINCLNHETPLYSRSKIKSLRPFLDEHSLLRVGGRLQCLESLSFDEKHPIILHKDSPLSMLIAQDAHAQTLHGGPQLLMSHIARKFWITNVHSLAKHVVNQCITCTRYAKQTLSQIMANLPKERINLIRPFLATGVDYAGPIQIRTTKGRGFKSYKGYICVFVCMASKAIHLEAVSDLTSKGFIQAYTRFVSRRGHCQSLASDNGPTFKGADRELREMFQEASTFYREVSTCLLERNTEWTFISPYAPHMGGLWEAGVKSVKHHLRRVIGSTTLTFEEITTLLCQIEACLNSRPLISMSRDPMDLAPLTPGHFLVGHALTTLPEPGFESLDLTPTCRYRLITKIRDDFWRRWKTDYLQTLQPRTRWQHVKDPLLLNSMVLLAEKDTPPAKWPIGRVVKLHPARDNFVRTVTVRTATGEYERPIVKLCLLPIAPDAKVPADVPD